MAIDKIDKVVLNQELVKEIESKATKAEVTEAKLDLQNQINAVVTSLDYKEAVSTLKDLALLYPKPKEGWTVAVKENGITYKYTNGVWVDIGLTSTPKATSKNDGLFTKEDYKKLSTIEENAERNFTPEEMLELIKEIDGKGSGLDADMLQGKKPDDFASAAHNHDGRYYTETEINTLLGGKSNTSHIHAADGIADDSVTDEKVGSRTVNQLTTEKYGNTASITQLFSWYAKRFKEILGTSNWYDSIPIDLKSILEKLNILLGHKHTGADGDGNKISYNDLTDTPTNLSPKNHQHIKADITDFTHEHGITDISGLQSAIDKKSDTHAHPYADENHNHNDTYYTETEIDTRLSGKADSSHTHPVSDMIDFSHGHVISDVKDLQTNLNKKADTHNHPYAADNHTHNDTYYTETEIDSFLADKADVKHTHATADINNNAVTDAKIGNRTINQAITTAYSNTGNITQIFSWYAKKLKEILGVDNWYGDIPASLSEIWDKFKASTGHKHTGVDGDGAKIAYKDLSDCPTSFTPASHKHSKTDITDFSHQHAITDITNLQNSLNGKSDTNHTHENLGAKVNIGTSAPTSPKVNEIWIDTN